MIFALQNFDELEVAQYQLANTYFGLCKEIADYTQTFRAVPLSQAINPNYHERPSFITRTAIFFSAWLTLHPRSGSTALHKFVETVLQYAPNGDVEQQIVDLEAKLRIVRNTIRDLHDRIEEVPLVRLETREIVKKRRERTPVKKIRQPPLL